MKKSILFSLLAASGCSLAQLAGTVTVGPGGDYATISQVIFQINAFGTTGHVTVDIFPGTYTDHIYLNNISDLTADSTVLFRAADGPGTVTIQTLTANPTSALIKLNNTSYLTFEDIHFNIGSQNILYVEADHSDELTFNSCTFIEPANSANSFPVSGRVEIDNSDDVTITDCFLPRNLFMDQDTMVNISGCEIRKGYYADWIVGSTVMLGECDHIYLEDNLILDYGISGHASTGHIINCVTPAINISNWYIPTNNILVKGNTITGEFISILSGQVVDNTINMTRTYAHGIEMENCDSCIVEGNILNGLYKVGIYAEGDGIIRNNMIGSSWNNNYMNNRYGMDLKGEFYVSHNSIYMNNVTVDTEAAGIRLFGQEEWIVNNIIYLDHPVAAGLLVVEPDNTFHSDHNVLVNSSGPVGHKDGNNYYTLSQWNTATGKDANSVSTIPQFVSNTDLHLVQATGIPVVPKTDSVFFDFDGEIRELYTHVGADQQYNTMSTIVDTACQVFTSPAGNLYTNTGVYHEVIPNAMGYDSLITIELLVISLDLGVSQDGYSYTSDAAGVLYQWLDCSNNLSEVPGATANTYTPPGATGVFAVELTGDYGCVDTSACIIFSPVGMGEAMQGTLAVFPNPVRDMLIVQHNGIAHGFLVVTDMTGRSMVEMPVGDSQTMIDLSEMASGCYILQLISGDGSPVAVSQLMVE